MVEQLLWCSVTFVIISAATSKQIHNPSWYWWSSSVFVGQSEITSCSLRQPNCYRTHWSVPIYNRPTSALPAKVWPDWIQDMRSYTRGCDQKSTGLERYPIGAGGTQGSSTYWPIWLYFSTLRIHHYLRDKIVLLRCNCLSNILSFYIIFFCINIVSKMKLWTAVSRDPISPHHHNFWVYHVYVINRHHRVAKAEQQRPGCFRTPNHHQLWSKYHDFVYWSFQKQSSRSSVYWELC